MWLVLAGTKVPREEVHLFRGFSAFPQRVRVSGEDVVAVHVPDDHPTAAETRGAAPRIADMRLVEDAQVEVIAVEKPATAPKPGVEEMRLRQKLYEQAIVRGWTADDLEGVWDGTTWTDPGDRSPVSGLTLLEAVQTRPPKDWAQLRIMGRAPWDSTDWTDPVQGWVPPAWTSRVRADEDAPEVPAPSGVDPDAEDSPTVLMDSTTVDPSDTTVVDSDVLSQEGELASGEVWLYDQDQLPRAQEVIRDLVTQLGADNLRIGRVNGALKKRGLKALDNIDQLQWFLTTLSTTE